VVRAAPSHARASAAPTAGAPRQGALGEGVYVGIADVPLSDLLELRHLGLEAARGGQVRDGVVWAERQVRKDPLRRDGEGVVGGWQRPAGVADQSLRRVEPGHLQVGRDGLAPEEPQLLLVLLILWPAGGRTSTRRN